MENGRKQQSYPLVSVIVPTYNHERYITKALDSILMQEGDFKYEILVGDDASQDRTVSILKSYKEQYPDKIHLFLNSQNMGATRNSYQLLSHARGKYLATCEGDDYWSDPRKLLSQIKFMEKHPDLIGCVHYCRLVDENGNKWRNQKLSWIHYKNRFTLNDFQGLFMPGQPSTFFRKNIISEINDLKLMYQLHPQIGDRTLMMLFLLHGDFGIIPEIMGSYRKRRKNRQSITDLLYRNKIDGWMEDYRLILQYEQYCREHGAKVNFLRGQSALLGKTYCWYLLKRDKKCIRFIRQILHRTSSKFSLVCWSILYALQLGFDFIVGTMGDEK